MDDLDFLNDFSLDEILTVGVRGGASVLTPNPPAPHSHESNP